MYHQWEARLQHFQEARLLVHVEARLLRSLALASQMLRLEARLHRFQVGCQARQVHHQPGMPLQQWAGPGTRCGLLRYQCERGAHSRATQTAQDKPQHKPQTRKQAQKQQKSTDETRHSHAHTGKQKRPLFPTARQAWLAV